MVKYYTHDLDVTFMALADATRRQILTTLLSGDRTVTEIARPFDMSLPAITKHLNILENAGLLVREKQGRSRICRLRAGPMKEATEWLEKYSSFWNRQLDALDNFLNEDNQSEEK